MVRGISQWVTYQLIFKSWSHAYKYVYKTEFFKKSCRVQQNSFALSHMPPTSNRNCHTVPQYLAEHIERKVLKQLMLEDLWRFSITMTHPGERPLVFYGRTNCMPFLLYSFGLICSQSTWKLWKKKISHSAKCPWSLDCCCFIFCMSSAKDSLNDI